MPCDASGNYLVANADGADRPAGRLDPGRFLSLGDIAAGESRVVRFDYPSGNAAALHFTATSWNATAAPISIRMSATTPVDVAAVDVPGNDAFAGAEVLADAQGSRQVDLLHASTEPGEADYVPGAGRPAGSVWYRWKATTAGPVHFGALLDDAFALRELDALDRWEMRVEVYQGDSLASARRVASSPWGASFFALPDTDYVVRLATWDRVGPATVYWQQGERPENDRFDAATAISGEQGSEAGTNLGATSRPRGIPRGAWRHRVV